MRAGRLSKIVAPGEGAALLADDIIVTMPPIPPEYCGRHPKGEFLAAAIILPGGRGAHASM